MTVSREEFEALREQVEVLQVALGTATGRADAMELELNKTRGRAMALQHGLVTVATIPGLRAGLITQLEKTVAGISPALRDGAQYVLDSMQAPTQI